MIARQRAPSAPLLLLALFALLSTSLRGASAFYDSGSPVVSLTAAKFDAKIKSGGVWLVEVRGVVCVQVFERWARAASRSIAHPP